jgi:D-threonate/D-erythronate kinase
MKPVIVIADDLTGAADTGVCFTRAGLSAVIAFSPESNPGADVLVFSTESRYAGKSEARKRIRCLVPHAKGAAFIYKKIDSTLRGYPGAELAEIMAGLGVEKALVAPAFPAQGRTTVGGRQLIAGIPIEHTSFQREVASSELIQIFGACDRPVRLISLPTLRSNPAEMHKAFASPGPAVIIGDAETDADLQILAAAARQSGIRLFCGSAGLAAALATQLPAKSASGNPTPFRKHQGPVLVIAGSRNPVTAAQVKTAQEAGVAVVELDPDFGCTTNTPSDMVINVITPHLIRGQDVILTAAHLKDSPYGATAVAERLAQCASFLVNAQEVGGLVLTGGDIAKAVITALNANGIQLCGELQTGIPFGILVEGIRPDLPIITKAGGFGSKDALLKAIQFLSN